MKPDRMEYDRILYVLINWLCLPVINSQGYLWCGAECFNYPTQMHPYIEMSVYLPQLNPNSVGPNMNIVDDSPVLSPVVFKPQHNLISSSDMSLVRT